MERRTTVKIRLTPYSCLIESVHQNFSDFMVLNWTEKKMNECNDTWREGV